MSRSRKLMSFLIPAAIATAAIATTATITRADDDDAAAEARAEAEQARRDAEQAQRDAEQAHRDAERKAREAERLARQAGKQAAKGAAKAAKGQIKAARAQAREQLERAREQIAKAPMPEKMRQKILARLDRAAKVLDEHLANATAGDMDDLEREMEAMGEELEREMEAMAEELAALGEDWEDWAPVIVNKVGSWTGSWDGDVPEPPEPPDAPEPPDFGDDVDVFVVPPVPPVPPVPGLDLDLDDIDITIDIDLGALKLSSDQLGQLDIIFDAEQDVVEPAREQIEDLSEELHDALAADQVDEAKLARLVDEISEREAAIRKAQILAWAKSKRLLDAGQRDRIEKATVKSKRVRRVR
jgi:hypothetical protein